MVVEVSLDTSIYGKPVVKVIVDGSLKRTVNCTEENKNQVFQEFLNGLAQQQKGKQ